MPHHEHVKVEGRIGDIFFHRFVIVRPDGTKILADVGPIGVDAFPLETGTQVIAEGEMKPSELKVERITRQGEAAIKVAHKTKHPPHHDDHHHKHHEAADPEAAQRAIVHAGFQPIGAPRRKPKHFEVLGRKGDHLFECHVTLEGHIRKEKPVDQNDEKWSLDLQNAA